MDKVLDKFQKEAIHAIDAHKTVVVAAPTGAGKTVIAEYVVEKGLCSGKQVIYTAPIKALSNQKYRDFSAEYGGKIGIVTGDLSINANAPVVVMTTEIFRNTIFDAPESLSPVDYVIFDEVHYINDIERGTVWEESIIFAPEHIEMLCLSATIPNLLELVDWMSAVRNRDVAVIEETRRPVPLEHAVFIDQFGVGTLEDVEQIKTLGLSSLRIETATPEQRRTLLIEQHLDLLQILQDEGKLPCLYFCQSRKRCQGMAFENTERELLSKMESQSIVRIYDNLCLQHNIVHDKGAALLRDMVKRGVAYHHAGMLPALKDVVERLFTTSLIKLIFTTETFAVGVNMPVCSVVFDSLEKFDGVRNRYLKAREYHQMAGRAGRRGMDDVGYVYARVNPHQIDINVARKIVSGEIESIDSQFDLSYSSILNLYARHGEDLYHLMNKSLSHFQALGEIKRLDERLEQLQLSGGELAKPDLLPVECIHSTPQLIEEYQQISTILSKEKHTQKKRERKIRREHKKDKRAMAEKLRELNAEFDAIETQRTAILCHTCEHRGVCLQRIQKIQKATRATTNIQEQKSKIESYHAEDIYRRLQFLDSLGYLNDDGLSPKGNIAARIHCYELHTTELLLDGYFDLLNEVQLNILATAIIFESRDDTFYKEIDQKSLDIAFADLDKRIQRLQYRQTEYGIATPIKRLDASLSSVVNAWSKECEFEELSKYTDATDGDIVRAFRLSINLLRQIERAVPQNALLREKIVNCITRMKRGVVDAELQLRVGGQGG